VDAGWRPHEDQVGQTGKTVSPTLYVAIGISARFSTSRGCARPTVIVAHQQGQRRAIFKVADYGIVGDLFEVVPRSLKNKEAAWLRRETGKGKGDSRAVSAAAAH